MQRIPYPYPMTPEPVAWQGGSVLLLLALPSLRVCAFLVVDGTVMMNYRMRMTYRTKTKMHSDDSCQ